MKKHRGVIAGIIAAAIVFGLFAAVNFLPLIMFRGKLVFSQNDEGTYYVAHGYVNERAQPKKVVVPETYNGLPVKAIEYGAFYSQTIVEMTELSLPDSLWAIYGAPINTSAFYQNEENWTIETRDGVTYKALYVDNYLLKLIIECQEGAHASYRVKDGTLGISALFLDEGCENLSSLYIPESVRFIAADVEEEEDTYKISNRFYITHSSTRNGRWDLRILFDGNSAKWRNMTSEVTAYTLDEYNERYADASSGITVIVECNDDVIVHRP